ncbi:hypothetical protein P4H94_22925 [Paenibacillus macerans]|uniref:hypothetical protein n=1 Tax=Paenibacillus macerans TaxID=44252 RepID=UPI001B00CB1E|nr:hypothetical protein [Paenibacillus macerans]MEC0139709.1 hypothetical protein [Paenibacillus macerans]GIP10421.1 hypothetical protein J1TS5_25910 [Paenibacillus macerans]
MNKQPRLIDADKVIQDVERRMNELLQDSSADYDRFPVINALENFVGRLKSDMYDPDPAPVPTIKPKDWVRHRSIKAKGFVVETSDIGALIYWETGQRSWYPYDHLEVISHD